MVPLSVFRMGRTLTLLEILCGAAEGACGGVVSRLYLRHAGDAGEDDLGQVETRIVALDIRLRTLLVNVRLISKQATGIL